MKVNEIHSQGTVHIPMTCNLGEAAIQMRKQHVGALVITEGGAPGRMIGIVTDRDIVLKTAASSAAPECTAVADVMSMSVIAIDEDADVAEAMQLDEIGSCLRVSCVASRTASARQVCRRGFICKCSLDD